MEFNFFTLLDECYVVFYVNLHDQIPGYVLR